MKLFPFSPDLVFASLCPEIHGSVARNGLHSAGQDFLFQGKSTLSLSDSFCSPHSQQIPKTSVSGFV